MKGVTFPDAAPDGLFSGDSVFVNTEKFMLTITNVSPLFLLQLRVASQFNSITPKFNHNIVQSASNSISLFGINPFNLTSLRPIGKPASSGGEFPNSATLNKAATRAYVLNTGKVNGVQ